MVSHYSIIIVILITYTTKETQFLFVIQKSTFKMLILFNGFIIY